MTGETTGSTRHLEGSWILSISRKGSDAPPLVEAAVFISGGSMFNIAPDGTASAGTWIRTADGQFAITFMGFLLREKRPFRFKIRANMTLNESENEFSGQFQRDDIDPDGNVISSVTGTVQATRMHVEPLE